MTADMRQFVGYDGFQLLRRQTSQRADRQQYDRAKPTELISVLPVWLIY